MIEYIEELIVDYANMAWGAPLLILLLGGGLFFVIYSRLIPLRYLGHAINILRGKYDDEDDVGQINHYEALSTALAATVGMGNIGGVAAAITTGGPGAIFWMWVSAFIGMATKYFTCTLSIMYRGKDSNGEIQGGPMYVIVEGLGKNWKWLAVLFSVAGLFGMLPIFQSNQLTQVINDILLKPNGFEGGLQTKMAIGVCLVIVVASVIFGGVKRIGHIAGKLVPLMVVLYFVSVVAILIINWENVPSGLMLIFQDAFTGDAVLGGALGAIIIAGVRRAAFSNEAGIGTAPMAHGAAKTDEPVREGLVAMLGPAIDTLIVCTLTAMAIISTGVWENTDLDGVSLTAQAFATAMPGFGVYILLACVLIFAVTSLFSFSYYGTKCLSFLIGAKYKFLYNYFYVAMVLVGATASMKTVMSLIDGMYATMALPTMLSAIILAPKVVKESKKYFAKLKASEKL